MCSARCVQRLSNHSVQLSAICPFLVQFGFGHVAAPFIQHQGQIELLSRQNYDPGREAVEVVGPQNTDFLNQIATFRLARYEVEASDTASTTSPGAMPTPGPVPTRPLADQGQPESPFRQMTTNQATQSTWDENSGLRPMQANNEYLEPPTLPLSQEDYLTMAGEIGDYMNWDGSYLSADYNMIGDFR